MKHTPAPWKMDLVNRSGMFDIYVPNTGIAKVKIQSSERYGESEANARLIAAAPELLKALKWIEICSSQIRTTHSEAEWNKLMPESYPALLLSLDQARALIAQVEGVE